LVADRQSQVNFLPSDVMSFGFVELQGGTTRVRIIPALGGRIASLSALGREWLWANDALPPREPVDGASYSETGDSGGYDECFPTVAACNIPNTVARFGGLALPDHGELWAQRAAVAVETHAEGHRAICTWEGRRLPYLFTRVVQVTSAGAVVMHYTVRNTGRDRLPFLWSAQPLFPLTAATRIDLPVGARTRVWSHRGEALRGLVPEFRWPHARMDDRIADLSQPDLVGRQFACKLFLDVPPGTGLAAIEEGGVRLEVEFDERVVPNLGVWLNKGEWTPFKGGKPYLNVAIEPCIGPSDSLADALGAWGGAHWIEPEQSREWALTWRPVRTANG
jgi:galactose mutarotase-like enzyme